MLEQPSATPDLLRVASYNIYRAHWFDRPGRRRGTVLDDLARLERLREADVLLLQEAFVGRLRDGAEPRDTVQETALALGIEPNGTAHAAFEGVSHRGGHWGVGIVTRYPASFKSLSLPRARWSPWQRTAILAQVGPWVVGTLHLEVWPIGARARQQQTRAILEALEAFGAPPEAPVILGGDFNCQNGGPHAALRDAGFRPALQTRIPTFAFPGLRLHLDHIYVRNAAVIAAGVEHAARGSDHWPVWAEIRR